MTTEQEVLKALSEIIDPDMNQDIVSLGFVKNLKITGGTVSFAIELTTPACPVKEHFRSRAEELVNALDGVSEVLVSMTAMKPKARKGEQVDGLKDVGAIVAISSCKGGVGKSTVAAYLARAMQRSGLEVGLLDLDVHGPSLPTLFKAHHPEVFTQNELILPVEVDGLRTMSLGYMLGDKPAVMRGPMAASYSMQIMQQTFWGKLDYLLIDLPPGTGDIQLSLTQQTALDGAVIITTPQALSLVDVARGILMFEKVQVPVLGVVENMSSFTCDNCDKEHFLFGDKSMLLKERFGIDTLANLPILPGLCDASTRDAGAELTVFNDLADNLHRAIGKRRIESEAPPEATPVEGAVQVRWPDGTEAVLPNKLLRGACQCAICVDEFTREQRLDKDNVPDNIAVENLESLGNYAISIAWNDGHSSGIYAWTYLRELADSLG